jgi:hypothetical protein
MAFLPPSDTCSPSGESNLSDDLEHAVINIVRIKPHGIVADELLVSESILALFKSSSI